MREIDKYSFRCGVIDCFNEMVAAGVKRMAFSHTSPTAEERDACLQPARAACEKYGTRLYPESDLLVTDLYPVSMCRGKHIIIFYGAEGDLKEYQDLKALKKALVESKAYHGDARYQLAYRMGKLLSYTDDAIARMIASNPEKE